jgi:hypothetical protein
LPDIDGMLHNAAGINEIVYGTDFHIYAAIWAQTPGNASFGVLR